MASKHKLQRPMLTVLFTTSVSALLLWQRSWSSAGFLQSAVIQTPGTVSFITQLVASLLGTSWVYVLCSIFNLTTRLQLVDGQEPTLQTLNVWAAIGSQRIDFTLPVHYTALTFVVLLTGHGVGALWGPAISPFQTTADVLLTNLSVPIFNENSIWMAKAFSNQTLVLNDIERICQTDNTLLAPIPKCPVPGLQDSILDSASFATTLRGDARKHAKDTDPAWTYIGRSYGMGSYSMNVNLTAFGYYNADSSYFNYTEPGYMTNSVCTNASSVDFALHTNPAEKGYNLTLNIYTADGSLSNSNQRLSFPVVMSNFTEGVLTWAASGDKGQNLLSIAASGYYLPYNSVVCNISWTPTIFSIGVNSTDKTIYVQPQHTLLPNARSFDGHGYLRTNTMVSLSILAQTSASMFYAPLGQSLNNNWRTYYEQTQFRLYEENLNKSLTANSTNFSQSTFNNDTDLFWSTTDNATDLFRSTTPFPALQDSVNAMLDDIIVGIADAQLYYHPDSLDMRNSNWTRNANVTVQFSAFRLGDDNYIYMTLIINIVIFIIALEEASRTRNWHGLSLFDYQDVKSTVVAASAGGTAIANECYRSHGRGKTWTCDEASEAAAEIQVRLLTDSPDDEGRLVIVLADDDYWKTDVSDAEIYPAFSNNQIYLVVTQETVDDPV